MRFRHATGGGPAWSSGSEPVHSVAALDQRLAKPRLVPQPLDLRRRDPRPRTLTADRERGIIASHFASSLSVLAFAAASQGTARPASKQMNLEP